MDSKKVIHSINIDFSNIFGTVENFANILWKTTSSGTGMASETTRTSGNRVATRSLISNDIFWEEWGGSTGSDAPLNPENPGSGDRPEIE